MPQESIADHTPGSLRAAVERIHHLLAGVAETATEMERQGVPELKIKYQKALLRSLDELMRWSAAVQRAMTDRLVEIGALDASRHREMQTPQEKLQKSKKPKA